MKTRPEMTAQEEQATAASKPNAAGRISETGTIFSPDLIEEKFKANLEPLHPQISGLKQMMDKLIQDNSAVAYPTASTRECPFTSESPLKDKPETSRTLQSAPLAAARYSTHIVKETTQPLHRSPATPPQQADLDTDDKTLFPNRNKEVERQTTQRHLMWPSSMNKSLTQSPRTLPTRIHATNIII